jgi:NTE family protein
MAMGNDAVGLVLAGGGALGAYEAGALAELLPALAEDELPDVVVGTSVGALNTGFVAANAHLPAQALAAEGERRWRSVRYERVLEPLISLAEAERLGSYLAELARLPRTRLESLLDPAPLADTLSDWVDFDQLDRNVGDSIRAAAVVATSGRTNLSVVFHAGGPSLPDDPLRGITYVPTRLEREHLLASAAIPTVFPAVEVRGGDAPGWYFDGGTRLNTPIKPALALGATRVIVIALSSLTPRGRGLTAERPDALDGAGQLIQALLVDPLVNDVRTLASVNALLDDEDADRVVAHERRTGRRRVPYILIAPPDPDEIGRLASDVYARHYAGASHALGSLGLLGRLVDAQASATHGALLAFLLFAPEFVEELIALGRRDARTWLEQPHDDGLWQVGPLAR